MRDVAASFGASTYCQSGAAMAAARIEGVTLLPCARHVCLPLDVHKNGTMAPSLAQHSQIQRARSAPDTRRPSGGAGRPFWDRKARGVLMRKHCADLPVYRIRRI